jgi:hypothetical protein
VQPSKAGWVQSSLNLNGERLPINFMVWP